MFFRPMSCPHCGAPIAEESIGRSLVTCAYCKGTFAPAGRAVYRLAFARALSEAEACVPKPALVLRGRSYVPERELARSERAVVLLARAYVPTGERVIVKLARDPAHVERERAALAALAASTAQGHAHFTTRFPQVVAAGVAEIDAASAPAIAFRARPGHLHNGDDVARAYPSGIDGRHLVWIWRRTLEIVGFAHQSGFCHGALSRSHLVVAARDHGVLVVGWASSVPRTADGVVADLVAAAAVVRGLAEPTLPPPIAQLLADVDAGRHADAWALCEAIGDAARAAYGAPSFHPLSLPPLR